MKVKVTIGEPKDPEETLVLVDVLRSSTTISIALLNGAKYVIPFKKSDEARAAKDRLGGVEDILLVGEEFGTKPEGFDMTNSTRNMKKKNVEGKVLLYRSSNLTRVLEASRESERISVGGPINARAVANYLDSLNPETVEIVACGMTGEEAIYLNETYGFFCDPGNEISVEDIIGAGSIIDHLNPDELSDLAIVSLLAWRNSEWKKWAEKGSTSQLLYELGSETDLEDCFSLNKVDIVPILREGRLESYISDR